MTKQLLATMGSATALATMVVATSVLLGPTAQAADSCTFDKGFPFTGGYTCIKTTSTGQVVKCTAPNGFTIPICKPV